MGRRHKQPFLQRRHTNSQDAQEKMFNIINYQRNANQNYNEISPHTSQNGYHGKIHRQQMLERMWRQGNPPTLWWECKLVQPLWRAVWRFLKELKIELSQVPEIPLLGAYIQRKTWSKRIYTPQCSLQHCLQQVRHGSNLNVHQQRCG